MNRARLGRKPKYDWDKWTDGNEYELKHGEDFSCTAESFSVLVRRTARVRNLGVACSVSGDTVWIQFFSPQES